MTNKIKNCETCGIPNCDNFYETCASCDVAYSNWCETPTNPKSLENAIEKMDEIIEYFNQFRHDANAKVVPTIADFPISRVTRVEVIDQNGRSYVNWKDTNAVKLQIQDDGRTLKVFVSNRPA